MKMKTLSSVKTGRRGDTDQTHRAGGHGEPAKKLPCIQRGASLYWCGTSVRPAGGRHYGVCKNKEAAADLSRQIKTKLADKYYYAMTDGVPEKKKGTLEDELLQNGKTNTSEVVERGTPQAKHASLSYEVVEQDGKHAVLRIKLDTGRHHQIRVQLAHAGMPIVGDKKYNFKENIAPSGGQLALCSFKIAFRHPKTHRKLEFEIDKPFGLS